MKVNETGLKKDKLAIFDLDGTLFDTDEVNFSAYKEAAEAFGAKLDRDFFVKECSGRRYKEFLPLILGSAEHVEEAHAIKKDAYSRNLDKARVNNALIDYINNSKKDHHIAIVTTASAKNVHEILDYFKLEDLFELIITQEDIANPKPDPEGFLKAMEYFGIQASNTVIFEDSEVGIEAAIRSGASVMAVKQF